MSDKPEEINQGNPEKPLYAKPQLYAHYFEKLKYVAREMGFNLLLHGSMNRDCDLVAVRWQDKTADDLELVQALEYTLTEIKHTTPEEYLFKVLPGNRHSYVINLNRGGYYKGRSELGDRVYEPDPQYYLDISIPQTK